MPGPQHPKAKQQVAEHNAPQQALPPTAPTPEVDLKKAHEELQNLLPLAAAQARSLKTHGDAFYLLCTATSDSEALEGCHPLLYALLQSLISNDQINDRLLGTTAAQMSEAWKRLHALTSKAVVLCEALEQTSDALDNDAVLKSLE